MTKKHTESPFAEMIRLLDERGIKRAAFVRLLGKGYSTVARHLEDGTMRVADIALIYQTYLSDIDPKEVFGDTPIAAYIAVVLRDRREADAKEKGEATEIRQDAAAPLNHNNGYPTI